MTISVVWRRGTYRWRNRWRKAFELRQKLERDELRSTAYMALVEAARTFDPSRKVNFATFARHRIRGALRDYARFLLSESWRGETSASAFVSKPLPRMRNDTGECWASGARSPSAPRSSRSRTVEHWLRRLPATHALTCRLIYLGGKSQDEVAAASGLLQVARIADAHGSPVVADRRFQCLASRQRGESRAEKRPSETHDGRTGERHLNARSGDGHRLPQAALVGAACWACESTNWRIEPTTKFCCSSLSSG